MAHNHTMAASVNGVLHVAGGRPPRGSDFAVYDPSTDRWEVPAGLPTQRNHLAMVGLGGRVYVIGGRTGAVLVGGLIHLPGGGTSGGGASGSTVHQVYRPAPGQP